MDDDCVFCRIIAGTEPASVIHEDALCIAFMTLRPIRPGAFIVIPREHIDHFTDLPDDLATHLLRVGQHFGRRLLTVTEAARIGYVVHGFGVPHAHLNVVPQHDTLDIISARFVITEDGSPFRVTETAIEITSRDQLDAMARALAAVPLPL
ncbi:HIT family protein [Gymnodinialimonas hymeniacidonis]|uniref:HIT family protein n=1 Tax=Gymnodinialimonas hymeniacidonis TaxID=3126508 RepID=UPI0034C6C9F0